MPALQPFAANIWTAPASHTFLDLHVGTRMTIVRLSSGKLLLHSPIPLSDELRAAIDALGPVAHIVCPNLFSSHVCSGSCRGLPEREVARPGCVAAQAKGFRLGDQRVLTHSESTSEVRRLAAFGPGQVALSHPSNRQCKSRSPNSILCRC
ncbi:MAG TPA: DUF4336 domain-containing protein [Paraburkholderia sp.]|nr:DUF4336 domain-containing protein [Paraburkholderia sp.]